MEVRRYVWVYVIGDMTNPAGWGNDEPVNEAESSFEPTNAIYQICHLSMVGSRPTPNLEIFTLKTFCLIFETGNCDIIEVLAKTRKITICILGAYWMDQAKNALRRKNQ